MKYSVLISIYYKENPLFLEQSIDSVLNQTIKPNEIVIVKDGPLTKELDHVLEKYKSNHAEIFKIIKLESNMGLGIVTPLVWTV
ncbi:glycosyltransferase, partial [Flammeovirga sp. OC4]|uniref:glycosyltransferase n=1 Tax=Flammeovirga sp. OC4 TaxID=1382345 RepID=UPI0005C464D3